MQRQHPRKQATKAPTYEQFMATLAASQEAFEKRLLALEALQQKREEIELAIAQERKEAERERNEADKKIDRQITELNKQMGYVSNRMGEVVEALAGRAIYKQLAKLGHKIRSFEEGVKLRGKDFQVVAEVDAVLYNAQTVFLAEVKTKITSQHIDQHLRRIETVRRLSTDIQPEMPIAGIVAAVVFPDAVATYAMKKGLLVVRPENELFGIINPPGFEIRFW